LKLKYRWSLPSRKPSLIAVTCVTKLVTAITADRHRPDR